MAAIADKTVSEVIGLLGETSLASLDAELCSDLPMFELIADWYCLRQGAGLALAHIAPQRLSLYRMLADRFGREPDHHDGSVKSFIEIFFGALGLFLERAEGGSRHLELRLTPQRQSIAV